MKKLLTAILILGASVAYGDISVTQGSGKTVATYTVNSTEIQRTSTMIDQSSNTVIVSSIGVLDISGVSRPLGYSAPASSMPVNVLNVASVTLNGSLPTGTNSIGNIGTVATITNPVTVNTHAISNLNGIVISSFAATVAPMSNVVMIASSPVRTSGTTGEQLVSAEISASSNTVIVSTMQVITISGTSSHIGWDAQGSSLPVASAGPAIGATVAGAPLYTGAIVSSSTLPTFQTNGKGQYITVDPAGRQVVVNGVPTWMIKTATATITTTTTPITIISSGGANAFNDLCGCIGLNTSATNTYATFQSTGALTGGGSPDFTLGLPANMIPTGFGPANCASPIPQRASNANWLITIANSVTDIRIACYYYTIVR